MKPLNFDLLPTALSIYRFAPDQTPDFANARHAEFYSVTQTRDEISIVTASGTFSNAAAEESDWQALKLCGVFDLSLTGILAHISGLLAEHGVALFAISTFDTDYILVKSAKISQAITALTTAGHRVNMPHAGRIRAAVRDDIPMLAKLIREANRDVAERFHLTPENAPKHTSNCQNDWIETAMDKGVAFYVLECEQVPCGCVAMEHAKPELCYLERLAVLPRYRRRGFGEALVRHVFHEAHQRQIQRVEIGTIAEHVELTRWYEKLGFTLKETRAFPHLPFQVAFLGIDL